MAESSARQEDERSIKTRQAFIYGSLVIIAMAAAALLILIWQNGARYNTLPYELAKTCIQVLGVTLVGAVVSFAGFTFQRNRERREHESDQKHQDLQREIERTREEWRRYVEQVRDARQRKDQLLRATHDETLSAYHTVKRTRRILRAQIWTQPYEDRIDPEVEDRIDPEVYDQQMALINDVQLQFEELKRTAPLIDDARVDEGRLRRRFVAIERYLGELISEYEVKRRSVAYPQFDDPTPDMLTLHGFLDRENKGVFNHNIADPINDILGSLQRALLEPLKLPEPTAIGDINDMKAGQ